MSVIGTNSFNKLYSEEIKRYLDDGYHIVPPIGGMRSHSSAIVYTDFMNDRERSHVTRIWLIESSKRINDYYCDCTSIVIRKYKIPSDSYRTLWPDDGDFISRKDYYIILRNNRKRAYTDSAEEFCACMEKQRDRDKVKKELESTSRDIGLKRLPPDFIDNLMERVNQLQGFKKATSLCIKRVYLYHDTDYRDGRKLRLNAKVEVEFNGKHRSLWYR
jgi:hypothetical protein